MSYVLKYSGSICGGWGWLDSYHAHSLQECKEACAQAGKSKCNWFAYNDYYKQCRPVPGTCKNAPSRSGYSIYMPAPAPTPAHNYYTAPASSHKHTPDPSPEPTPAPVQKEKTSSVPSSNQAMENAKLIALLKQEA